MGGLLGDADAVVPEQLGLEPGRLARAHGTAVAVGVVAGVEPDDLHVVALGPRPPRRALHQVRRSEPVAGRAGRLAWAFEVDPEPVRLDPVTGTDG